MYFIVGGLGTSRDYFQNLISLLDEPTIFYDFKIDLKLDHAKEILEQISKWLNYDKFIRIKLVSYSISVFTVYKLFLQLKDSRVKLILIDPPNIFPELAFCKIYGVGSSFTPFKSKKIPKYFQRHTIMILSKYSYLIDLMVYICKFMPICKQLLLHCFTRNSVQATPEQVDNCLFEFKAFDIYRFVVRYMLQEPAFEIDKPNVHVISGTDSIYNSFHDRFSSCQIHHITDGGHHLCYWNFERVAGVMMKI